MNKAKSGKEGTKGSKQIKEENKQTYERYWKFIAGVYTFTVLIQFIWSYDSIGWVNWLCLGGATVVYLLCMMTVQSMLTSGLDINADSGVAEHIKDIIGLTVICQGLSNISLYFLFLWLVIPIAAIYKLWVSVIAPWIFQEAPEMTDKQKKKMERKNQTQFRRY